MLFRVMMNGEQQGKAMSQKEAEDFVEYLQTNNPGATIWAMPIIEEEGTTTDGINFTWWEKFKIYTYAAKVKADAEVSKTTPREIGFGVIGLLAGIAAAWFGKQEYDKQRER